MSRLGQARVRARGMTLRDLELSESHVWTKLTQTFANFYYFFNFQMKSISEAWDNVSLRAERTSEVSSFEDKVVELAVRKVLFLIKTFPFYKN